MTLIAISSYATVYSIRGYRDAHASTLREKNKVCQRLIAPCAKVSEFRLNDCVRSVHVFKSGSPREGKTMGIAKRAEDGSLYSRQTPAVHAILHPNPYGASLLSPACERTQLSEVRPTRYILALRHLGRRCI